MVSLTFTQIHMDDLTRKDKKALNTLYLYYLEKNRPIEFDLPLFVSDEGKGVLSVECFKRVFFAFEQLTGTHHTAEIINGNSGENSYNIVRIKDTDIKVFDFDFVDYVEPKKTELKRESSKATKEKAIAKKASDETKKAEIKKTTVEKVLKNIEKVLPNYGKFEKEKLNACLDAIKSILEEA